MKNLYIIAETACSHDGSVARLKKMTKEAVKAGFDAIQFQIWKPENIMPKNHKDFKLLKKIQISYKQWEEIIKYTKNLKKKIDIIACIYDENALEFCKKNQIKIFKIHSADLGNKRLINKVSTVAKRIDLSIGSSTELEIKQAISWIDKKSDFWLMYGYQLFPTNPKSLNLSYAKKLGDVFKKPIGYQDHSFFDTSGYTIPAVAIGLGINIIEKHVTDSNKKNRTDGSSAIEIKNYKKFISKCCEAKICIGKNEKKTFNSDEVRYRKYSKKIILYKNNLKKNHQIKLNDITFLRSDKKGIMIDKYNFIIGRILNKNVNSYSPVKYKDLS
jgi:sialic acid synthase SpsE